MTNSNHTDQVRAAAEEILTAINAALAKTTPSEIKEAFGDDAGVQVGEGAIPKIAAIISPHLEGEQSKLSNEQQQKLDSLRQRHRMAVFAYKGEVAPSSVTDIDFLLSILESPAPSRDFRAGVQACVEKVKALRDGWDKDSEGWHEKGSAETRPEFAAMYFESRDLCIGKKDAANKIITALESLTDSAPSSVVLVDREEAAKAIKAQLESVPAHSESFVGFEHGFKAGVVNSIAALNQLPAYKGE